MKKMHLSVMVCLVLTLVSLQADILLEEGFEGGMIPAGWAQSFIVGSNSWVFQNGGHNGNPPSAHSGNYNAHLYNSSWTETMLITPSLNLGTSNPGELTFWHAQANWAGDQDFLYVYYKNSPGDTWTQIASYTTNVPSWTERILILPDPSLTYYIAFKGVTDFGYGVCLDDVTVTGQPIVYDYDLAALEIAGPVNINAGSSAVYEITVKNVGNLMQDSFTINLIRDGTITLVSQDITIPLAPGEELQQNLVWFIPPDEPLGSAELTGQVVAAVDQNNGNDFTPPLTVQIMPQGLAIITVGTGQDLSYYVPWNFYYKNSLTETIYYENELNSGGVITAISYYSNFLTNLPGMPVKVWIGETDITSLENNWIAASDLILVFDAEVDFPSGQHEIQLIFDEEFIYTGGNLAIMAQRPMDTDYYSSSDKFYNTLSSPYPNRTRYAYSDSEPYDPYNPPPLGWSVVVSDRLPNTTFYIIVGGLGTMDGFVRDDQDAPLPGAEVLIQETGDLTITNQDGFYSIINIPEGSYTARASLFGYSPHVQAVEIIGDEITPVDFVLIPLNIVNVSGFVVGSDHPEVGLEGAQISLTGFDDYYTVTDEEGYFFLSGVYTNITYHLEITCEGYEPYSEELFVGGEDLDLG
ncbi:MAG: carboxypeptidase regulatory-like domain-containing protein, partial [Candidatus Cloacimonetes bacterium]|nr:carboxypeptidase regulatory-like domain-containing protein [Candidatus Cloacimonadota bacterium]